MKMVVRVAAALLAVLLLLSTLSVAFAATSRFEREHPDLPASKSCTVALDGLLLQVSQPEKSTVSYRLQNAEVTLTTDSRGSVLEFLTAGNSRTQTVKLDKSIKLFTFSGSYDALTLAQNIDYTYTVTMAGAAKLLRVYGDVSLALGSTASVTQLDVRHNEAKLSRVYSTELAADANISSRLLTLTPVVRPGATRLTGAVYDEDSKTLTLTAQGGATLRQALDELMVVAKQQNNGWPVAGGGMLTASGAYQITGGSATYRFTPAKADTGHDPLLVTVRLQAAQ